MNLFLIALLGCGGSSDLEELGLPLFNQAATDADTETVVTHDISAYIEKIAGKAEGLNNPTDLEFNPDVNGELWIVNKDDDSTTTLFDAGTADQSFTHLVDPYALHFMEEVTSIAFGAPGTFGTCQDGTNTYNGASPGNLFTGPSLWSSDFSIYAQTNPEAVDFVGFDLGSHLDMLHESPECMGMAWDKKNVYWVFNGYHGSIDMYDFAIDHGAGFDDHSDGIIRRYVEGKVKRKNNVVSHLVLDHDTKLLYIANSGKGRIDVLDTTDGSVDASWMGFEPTDNATMKGVQLETLIDADNMGVNQLILDEEDPSLLPPPMDTPAGIDLVEGMLFITDNGNSYIYVYDLSGNLIDWAYTGLKEGSLSGIDAVSSEEIWFTDQKGNAAYRLTL